MKYKKLLVPIFVILLFLPLITHLIPIPLVYATDAWWNADYAYRKAIWIDARTISESLEDFVVMVHIGGEFYWVLTQNDGDDVRFANATGTEYIFELSSWDDGNDAFFWVKVPFITASSIEDNYFYMYYGNSTVGSGESPTAVWSEYILVHHIEEAAGNIMDQTMYDNDGINENAFAYSKPGLVGECGKGDHEVMDAWYSILDQSGTELDFGTGGFTVEVVTKGQSDQSHVPGDESVLIYAKGDSGGDWELSLTDNTGRADFWIYDGVNQPRVTGTTSMYTNNQGFTYIAGVRDTVADKLYVYVNGTEEDNTVDTCGSIRNNPDYGFCGSPTPGSRGADGYYEEVRISNMSRSAEYIEAENMNLFGEFALWTIENRAVEITNMEGCGDWVFAEEKYYTFQADVFHASSSDEIDTVKIAFTDGLHWINASYDHQTVVWSLDDGDDVVNIEAGTTVSDGNLLTITFPIYFKSGILDALDVDIWLWANATNAEYCHWKDMEVDYFNIYNLGGQAELTVGGESGYSGRITGGDVFELFAFANDTSSGNWALANVTYRNLQHLSFTVDLRFPYHNSTLSLVIDENPYIGYWLIGFDYCYEDVWYSGWYANITATDFFMGSNDRYLTYDVAWYYNNVLIKTDTLAAFLHGIAAQNNVEDGFGIKVDLWYNKINASTTIGGRISSQYFGISDAEPWWAFWTSNWGPVVNQTFQSDFFTDLTINGEVCSCRELDFMRAWAMVNNIHTVSASHNISFEQFSTMDWIVQQGFMEGINTPPSVAPSLPDDMPLSGLFAPFYGFFRNLVFALTSVLTIALNAAISFLDMIAGAFGVPNFFSDMGSYLATLFSYVGTAMANMATMLTQVFGFFTGPIILFLTYIGKFFASIWTTLTTMINIVTGAYGWSINIFDYFNIADFITLFFVFTVPLYMLNVFRNEGIGGVWRVVNTVMDVLVFFINLFIRIINAVIDIFTSFLEGLSAAGAAKG